MSNICTHSSNTTFHVVTFREVKALLWLGSAVLVILLLFVRGVRTFQILKGGATANARVVDTFECEFEDDSSRRFVTVTVAQYEFFVRGSRFLGETEGQEGSWSVGDTIPVEYNPANPTLNRAAGDRQALGNYLILLNFGGMFAYIAITINFPTVRPIFQTVMPKFKCNRFDN